MSADQKQSYKRLARNAAIAGGVALAAWIISMVTLINSQRREEWMGIACGLSFLGTVICSVTSLVAAVSGRFKKDAAPTPSLMIPVKIQCGCGQRYVFQFECIDGRLPSEVVCPVCGTDGTSVARELVTQSITAQPAATSPGAGAPASRLFGGNTSSPHREPKSISGWISASAGIGGTTLFYLSLVLRTLTWGFAAAADPSNLSPAMLAGRLLGIIALLIGIIAFLLKSQKRPAIVGIVSGALAAFAPILLSLLSGR